MLNERSMLRLDGVMSNKNKQIVNLLYPKLKFQARPAIILEGGFSFGSLHRQMLGFSHSYSQSRTVSYNLEHCTLMRKFTHSFSFKKVISDKVTSTNSLSFDTKGKFSLKNRISMHFDIRDQ